MRPGISVAVRKRSSTGVSDPSVVAEELGAWEVFGLFVATSLGVLEGLGDDVVSLLGEPDESSALTSESSSEEPHEVSISVVRTPATRPVARRRRVRGRERMGSA